MQILSFTQPGFRTHNLQIMARILHVNEMLILTTTGQESPYPPGVFRCVFVGLHVIKTSVIPAWCLAGVYDLEIWHVHH